MAERQKRSIQQRWSDLQPSKTMLFWSCAGSVAAALVVGFAWGGWTTGGSAREMAENSAAQARQELAAVVCVDRFMAAPDVGIQLTALKGMDRWYQQSKFVEEGGWAEIVPASTPPDRKASADDRKAAGLCAAELSKREIPTPGKAALINDEAVVAQ